MSAQTLTELLRLPARKRMAIAERLWLSVADEDSMPVPRDHRRVLQERIARYRAGKSKVMTHAELIRRLKQS